MKIGGLKNWNGVLNHFQFSYSSYEHTRVCLGLRVSISPWLTGTPKGHPIKFGGFPYFETTPLLVKIWTLVLVPAGWGSKRTLWRVPLALASGPEIPP